jgi:type IV pilus assembly protein PilM
MDTPKTTNFYRDKPLFGLDIGHGSLKVMQLADQPDKKPSQRQPKVVGYGSINFDKSAQEDGVIVKPEIIAKAALEMFEHHLTGDITTKRVALALPSYRTFTRSLHLPKLGAKEMSEAVNLEAEQYISLPLEELYLDYEIVKEGKDSVELFIAAVPRKIVDSYLQLTQILGLEAILIEPALNSSGRLFSYDKQSDVPAIIIDFGSQSSDITIFDKHIMVTGTVEGGGENFTASIKSRLGVSEQEAALIKTRYGLGLSKKQADIKEALEPTLEKIVKETRRMMRYYEERYGTERPIGQIISLGGGANMPGLSEYLTSGLHMASRHTDPWQYINFTGLEPPIPADRPMYATVAGLSLANPREAIL